MKIAELVLKYIEALIWPFVTLILVWGLRAHIRAAFARMSRLETPAGAIEFAVEARDVLMQAEGIPRAGRPAWPLFPHPRQAQELPREPEPQRPGPQRPVPPETVGSRPGQEDESARERPYVPQGPPPVPEERGAERSEPQAPAGRSRGLPRQQAPVPADTAPAGGPPPVPGPLESPVAGAPDGSGAYGEEPPWRGAFREARGMVDASPVGAVVTAWNALIALCLDVTGAYSGPMPLRTPPMDIERALTLAGLSPSATAVFERLQELRTRAVYGANSVTPGAARDFIDSCLTVAREVEALRNT